MRMIAGFAKRLRYLNNHIENITLKDVAKRVAIYLYEELNKTEKENVIKLKISKHDLASYLGTIIETLSRTFKKLQEDGIIEVDGKKIIIKSIEKLKSLIE